MRTVLRLESWVLALVVVLTCSACVRKEQPRPDQRAATAVENSAEPFVYPPGRWRLADVRELETTVLWVSHILIRHSQSDLHVMGSVFDWRMDAPPSDRKRADALAVAREIARKLAARSESFEALARRYSDDVTSAALGGSLGGTRASDFRYEPEVLDALAALHPGETSRVVETRHGFQIFRLRPVPEAGSVSGEHLVIGHDSAFWLKNVGASPVKRTRADALALAREIYARLVREPSSFSDQVQRSSEHPDRRIQGDIGTWSVREPTPHPRAVEALRGLPVGGISAPFESHYGVEIVRRTPNRQRPLYAMEVIKLAFDPDDPVSKRETYELARATIEVLKLAPTRFEEYQRRYCCARAERWFEGRDEPGLSNAVARLELGEIASAPVEQYVNWVIPKRIAASRVEPPLEPKFQVPAPERPKLDWAVQILPLPLLAKEIARLAQEYPAVTRTERERTLLQELVELANPALDSASPEASPSRFIAGVRELFENAERSRYRTLLEERIGKKIMGARIDG